MELIVTSGAVVVGIMVSLKAGVAWGLATFAVIMGIGIYALS